MSHAAGVGQPFPREVVRAMLLLRANTLALGHSGCRPLLVDRLLDFLAPGHPPGRARAGEPSGRRATSPRWPTSRCRSSGAARSSSTGTVVPGAGRAARGRPGAAGPRAQGGPRAAQRDADDERDRRAPPGRRRSAGADGERRRGDERRGAARAPTSPSPPPTSWPGRIPGQVAVAAELRHLLRDSGLQRSHHGVCAQGPGPVLAALRAPGPRRGPRRPRPPPAGPRHRAQLGDRQPARLPRRRRAPTRTRSRPAAGGSSAAATSTASRSRWPSTSPSSPSPSSARSASAGPRCSSTRGSTAGCRRSWRRRPASTRG